MSIIFVEVMLFQISENKNPSKITRYKVTTKSEKSKQLELSLTVFLSWLSFQSILAPLIVL